MSKKFLISNMLFLFSCLGFMVYNETIILPYYLWTPASMMTMEIMSQRSPLIHLALLIANFGLLCSGVKSYEKVLKVMRLDKSFNRFKTDEVLPQQDLRGNIKVPMKVDSK